MNAKLTKLLRAAYRLRRIAIAADARAARANGEWNTTSDWSSLWAEVSAERRRKAFDAEDKWADAFIRTVSPHLHRPLVRAVERRAIAHLRKYYPNHPDVKKADGIAAMWAHLGEDDT